MLSSGLVAVSLLLATHGSEGPREEKFRGALLAQNAAPSAPGSAATQREIDLLTIEYPSLTAPIVLLATGGGLAVVGGIILLAVALGGASGWAGVGLVFLSVIGIAVGGVVALIGLIALAVTGSVRAETDLRLQKLREQLKAAQPAAQSLAQPLSPLVLASF